MAIAYNPQMSKVVVVFCTFPDADAAHAAARALVEAELAACVNILPTIRSVYRWRGEVQDDSEALALMKTTEARFPKLRERLAELHPYECPEIIASAIEHGHGPYLDWVREMTGCE